MSICTSVRAHVRPEITDEEKIICAVCTRSPGTLQCRYLSIQNLVDNIVNTDDNHASNVGDKMLDKCW